MPATWRLQGGKEYRANLAILREIGFNSDDLYNKLGDAVAPMVAAAKANVSGLSVRVANSVDVWRKQPRSRPLKKSVMIIVNKRETMIQWTAGRYPTSPRVKVAPGEKVAESFATMLEIGTSKTWNHGAGRPAHYWFSRAVDATRTQVVANIMQAVAIMVELAARSFKETPTS